MTLWFAGGYGPDMDGSALGISALRSRPDGTLENLGVAAEAESPSILLAGARHVYAVAEGGGRVHSYRRDGEVLAEDGRVSSGGSWPCQLSLIDSALVVANYRDGALGVVSIREDGSVGELDQSIPGSGSGPHEAQEGPHAHASIRLDASTLVSLDLGSDQLHLHSITGSKLQRTGSFSLPPGTGPRDISRHDSGLLFVLGELSNEVFALEWTGGALELVASAAVPGAEPGDHGAGLSFGPNGFVYVGLRGSSRIGVLRASDGGRSIEGTGWVASEGDWPRHNAVDGNLLHVANQQSDLVSTFRLGADGIPSFIASTPVPSVTYLLRVE